MTQELVFTTLPVQRIEQDRKQYLKVSVYVSPHLKSVTTMKLGDAPDMFNWAEKIQNTEFTFRISGMKSDIPAIFNKSAIDKDLYRNIFHQNIQIEKYEMENLQLKPIRSFPVAHIRDFLLDQVKKIAIESPVQLVPASHFIDPDRLGIIADIQIDANVMNTENAQTRSNTVTPKPFILKNEMQVNNLRTVLKNNRFIPFKKQAEPAADFVQLKDFHFQNKKIVDKLVIRKPQFEFHNILSVMNSYPALMRRLGFILDFVIPYDTAIPASGTIQVVPGEVTFSEAGTKISAPKTAYNITNTGFYAADKAESVIKKGFVKINTSDFSVVQMDTDGMALKTAQTVNEKIIQVADYFQMRSAATLRAETALQNLKLKPQMATAARAEAGTSNVKTANSTARVQNIAQPETTFKPVFTFQKMKPVEKMKLLEVPPREGLHAMRSAGIALIRNGMSGHVAEKLQRNSNFQKMLVDNAKVDLKIKNLVLPEEILYSDDLVMAYRMDIAYEDNPGKWYSLHKRKMSYSWFDEAGVEHPIENISPDEG